MRSDPLAGVPTTWRLWGAAALCAAPTGTVWSSTFTPGTTLYGDCGYSDGPYCVPDTYLPGTTSMTTVAESPARVFLFAAIVALVFVAVRVRTPLTRRIARAATGSIAIAAVLAAQNGSRTLLVCTLLALVLTVPVVWGRVLASTPVPR